MKPNKTFLDLATFCFAKQVDKRCSNKTEAPKKLKDIISELEEAWNRLSLQRLDRMTEFWAGETTGQMKAYSHAVNLLREFISNSKGAE